MILYEAPHRLLRTLASLAETLGEDREIALCRELTKRFETVRRTTIGEAAAGERAEEPRGEYVLVIAGKSREALAEEQAARFESMDLAAHVSYYETQGLSRKEAMKAAARDRGISRRDVYQALLKNG